MGVLTLFGIKFAKFEPGTYIFRYSKGRLVQQGEGLSFFYFAPSTSVLAIPTGTREASFIFNELTTDFQEVTIQGQLVYSITNPLQLSKKLNYSLSPRSLTYASDDPEKLPQRIMSVIQVILQTEIRNLPLKKALFASQQLVQKIAEDLKTNLTIQDLGICVHGVSILAIKPKPETAKALEAETREQILRESDLAIFERRNSALENERAIRESELNTEIAVEMKNREIREARMNADLAIQSKKQEMAEADLNFRIGQEEKSRDLVQLKTENEKLEADAKAYAVSALMRSFDGASKDVLQVLLTSGMPSNQLIAMAFQGIAERADKIGQLNVTPDLLQDLLQSSEKKRDK